MLMRIASVLLSLLAHGTVLLYLGGFTPHDRPLPATSGKSLQVALVRAEKGQQEAMVAPVPEAAPKPASAKAVYQATPEPVVSPNESDRSNVIQQLLATQAPTAAGRPVKSPAAAVSKKPEAPVVRHAEPPPPMPEPQPANEPIVQRVANPSSSAGPVEQHDSAESPQQSAKALREIERAYMNALVTAIERHKRYPLRARKKGYEGEVLVLFTVLRDGTISEVGIGSSSLRVILDRAASKAVTDLGRFEPIPPQLDRDYWEFRVPIRFAMN
ncbi:energy transducer TonB [Sedimenticola selenatireducens]|uniref:energy transducer TonB n=1 Tax=Sedimenticola selenatireducens TaxID=191960 RepID=UPI00048A5831|nr:energy transducer TonB [Sedimenticola selenatireducens]